MKKITLAVIAALAAITTGNAAASHFQPLPATAPAPADNPTTPAKVELGKQLFMDPRLSASGTVSCNSCHNIMLGGEDNRPNSVGVEGKTGGRSAPTVWNAAFQSVQFWDGRAASLEEQAGGPMLADVEMGMPDHDMVMNRIKTIPGYVEQFNAVFGTEDSVTIDNATKAIAAFERTLITPNSPLDKYLSGDESALPAQAKKGLDTFAKKGCVTCHSGLNLSGPTLAEGQGFFQKFPTFADNDYEKKYGFSADKGLASVTNKAEDTNMFRVPTLRNIALTAPYFHNGAVDTLEEAVKVMGKVQLNQDISDEEAADIVAFLRSTTGEFPVITMPRLPITSGYSVIK